MHKRLYLIRFRSTLPVAAWILTTSFAMAAPSAPSGSSKASAPAAAGHEESAASLGVTIDYLPSVPDIARRRDPLTDIYGEALKAKNYPVLQSNFHLDFQLTRAENYSGALRASVGFRNAFEREDLQYTSTEFTGYSFAYRQRIGPFLLAEARFSDRMSPGLRLVSRHYAMDGSLSIELAENLTDKDLSRLSLRITPSIHFAKTTAEDSADIYDPRWAVETEIRYLMRDGAGFPVAFSIGGLFTRSLGYRLDGVDHGGAGLMTVTPRIESMLSPQLWVGLYVDVPTLRAKGREEAFNDPTLAGLYGHSGGFFVKSTSF